MEGHSKILKNRCRVCARKPAGYIHNKLSTTCESLLSTLLKIDARSESEEIFPPVVCNSCYLTLKKAKKEGTNIALTTINVHMWEPHTDSCQLCLASPSGGRPKKKRKGRPSEDDPTFHRRKIGRRLEEISISELADIEPIHKSQFLPSPYLDDLVCRHCNHISSQSVELATCRHHLCVQCVQNDKMTCPCNGNTVSVEHLTKLSPLTVNMKTLCDSVPVLAQERCAELVPNAEFVRTTFTKVFGLFSKCHSLYDSSKELTDANLSDLGMERNMFTYYYAYNISPTFPYISEKHIDEFLAFYRDTFPHATVTPKLHMLEDHVVPFLKQWKVGFGFLGEQGAESIHARFTAIRRNFTNMPNRVVRLQAILNEHLTQVCPENIVKYPIPKKRKKTTEILASLMWCVYWPTTPTKKI